MIYDTVTDEKLILMALQKVVEEISVYKFMRGRKYGGFLEIPPYLDPFKYGQ